MKLCLQKFVIVILVMFSLISCTQKKTIFHDSKGRVIDFANLAGKWVVINYWATWCHSCTHEIPELNAFYRKYKDKNVIIIGVNYDNLQNPQLSTAIKKFNIAYPVLQEDPNKLLRLGTITVVPTTFILNAQEKTVKRLIGPQTVKKLEKFIR